MRIVAIDTMVLIWGTQHPRDPKLKQLHARARILLRQLEGENARVLVSTVTVAEFLAGVPKPNHGKLLAELGRRFVPAAVDLPAATIAAEIWQRHSKLDSREQMSRRLLKSDSLIVGSVKSAGATAIYSHDAGVRRLAAIVQMEGLDLPTHHDNMFIDHEERQHE